MRSIAMLVLVGLSEAAFACSGPRVAETIERADQFTRGTAAVSFVLLLATLYGSRRTPWVPATIGGLLLVHPAWTMSTDSGDCGSTATSLSLIMVIASFAAAFTGLWLQMRATVARSRLRKSPPG